MKIPITTPILIPALALLLLMAAFIGYQAVSAQTSQGPLGGDPPLRLRRAWRRRPSTASCT